MTTTFPGPCSAVTGPALARGASQWARQLHPGAVRGARAGRRRLGAHPVGQDALRPDEVMLPLALLPAAGAVVSLFTAGRIVAGYWRTRVAQACGAGDGPDAGAGAALAPLALLLPWRCYLRRGTDEPHDVAD